MINKLKKKQQKRLFILYKNLYKHIKILNKSKLYLYILNYLLIRR